MLQKFDTANKALDERPKVLRDYAEYVKAYTDIHGASQEMDEAREEVESMYQMLRQYNVRVTGEDQYQMEFLQTKGNDFTHKKLIEAHQHIEERKREMIEQLASVSQRVEEDAREITEALKRSPFVDEDAIHNPDSALEELATVQTALVKVEEKAAAYNEYQGLFGVPDSFEFSEVEKGKSLFADKQKLWTLVHE